MAIKIDGDTVIDDDRGINVGSIISDVSNTGEVFTIHRRTVIASIGSLASGNQSSVIASAQGNAGPIRASGTNCVVISSFNDCDAGGINNAIIAGNNNFTSSVQTTVIGSAESTASNNEANVIGSSRVINNVRRSLALGFSSSGDRSTANRKIHLFGEDGNISISGSLSSSASFSDIAEMLPNGTGKEIPPGTLLTLEEGAVRPADDGEEICGVVSHTAAILAGDSPFCWQGRYLHDEFGRRLYEDIPDLSWEPSENETEKDRPMQTVLKENPNWNPDLPQVPRSERPEEWTPVGMIGQVFVRTGEKVNIGDRIFAKNGKGYKTLNRTGLKVIKIVKEFNDDYGVVKCLINVMI